MTIPDHRRKVEFGGSAAYRIVVQGMVSESWQGRLCDQAALHGLIDTLYALHLPILEVTKVDG
ncbi:MAG: hypothetical protein GY697_08665 [Desulfobacterales bacterium]|nr:hypothetical protein [Desulfobacterales bacterium]